MNRLEQKDKETVISAMMEKFGYKNVMEVPRVEKVVINIGVGDAIQNAKALEDSVKELEQITGQKAVVTKAKKSIANFKLRAGMPIGCKVTLRSEKMYDFLDKLMNISLPPIDYDKVSKIRGMDVVIVTTAKTNDEAKALLTDLGMPFKK